MNINDFQTPEAVPYSDMLRLIFQRQRELIEKYHDIEARSGIFNYQDPNVPVGLHTLAGQVRLKDFAWRTMEEVAEALDSHSIEHGQEEIADALHFFVELCILAGYEADFFGTLPELYDHANHTVWGISDGSKSGAVSYFLYALGNAMNKLKNKPWKQSQMLTDIPLFQTHLKLAMLGYVKVAISFGISTPGHLYDLYFRKSEVNKFRQRSGY